VAYASQADLLLVGLPQTAVGTLGATTIAAALQNASDFADGFFRARWGTNAVPLLAWDTEVTEAVAKIAAYRLMRQRGFNAAAGADKGFREGYDDAVDWLDRVQRQQAHPHVTLAATSQPGTPQPKVVSSSVVNLANGRRAPNRGW